MTCFRINTKKSDEFFELLAVQFFLVDFASDQTVSENTIQTTMIPFGRVGTG